jgi:hypothetical protein
VQFRVPGGDADEKGRSELARARGQSSTEDNKELDQIIDEIGKTDEW